jgi:sec-independent protein translocase protein TatA
MLGDIIQPTHLLIILVVALLVLGPKRLPDVGRSLGQSITNFRHGLKDMQEEARAGFDADSPALGTAQDTSAASFAQTADQPLAVAGAEAAGTLRA